MKPLKFILFVVLVCLGIQARAQFSPVISGYAATPLNTVLVNGTYRGLALTITLPISVTATVTITGGPVIGSPVLNFPNSATIPFFIKPTSTTTYTLTINASNSTSQTVTFVQSVATVAIPTITTPNPVSAGSIMGISLTSALPNSSAISSSFFNPSFTSFNNLLNGTNSTSALQVDAFVPSLAAPNYHWSFSNNIYCGIIDFPINLITSSCGLLSGYTPVSGSVATGTYTNGLWQINSAVNIVGNVTISNSTVAFEGNGKIIVPNGATLTLLKSTLGAACAGVMWQGIEVQPGGQLITNDITVIRDAQRAVTLIATTNTLPNGKFTANRTILNKNQIGVYMEGLTGTVSDLIFNNSMITCRTIPTAFFLNTNAQYDAFMNNLYNTPNPDLYNFNTTWTYINTIEGKRSFAGIFMRNMSPTGQYVVTSASSPRLIDSQNYGVYSYNSNYRLDFVNFSYIKGYLKNGSQIVGAAVYAEGTFKSNTIALNHDNAMECFVGYYIDSYNTIQMEMNYVDNQRTHLSTDNLTLNNDYTGYKGIYVTQLKRQSGPAVDWHFHVNAIYNARTGIHLNRNDGGAIASIYITCNNLGGGATYYTQGTFNKEMDVAIKYELLSNALNAGGGITIDNNTATNFNLNMVYLSNIKHPSGVSQNGGPIPSFFGFGGIIQNGLGLDGVNSTRCEIYKLMNCENINVGFNAMNTLSSASYTTFVNRGIALYNSPNCTIQQNQCVFVGTALYFNGNCSPTTIKGNFMNNVVNGLYLDNNGVVGPQGSPGAPSGNVWGTNIVNNSVCNNATVNPNSTSPFYGSTSASAPQINHISANASLLRYNSSGMIITTGTYTTPPTPVPFCQVFLAPYESAIEPTTKLANEEQNTTVEDKNTILVYPNPSSDKFNVLTQANANAAFELFDLSGRVLMKFNSEGKATTEIDLTGFEKGIYLLRITTVDQQKTERLILH